MPPPRTNRSRKVPLAAALARARPRTDEILIFSLSDFSTAAARVFSPRPSRSRGGANDFKVKNAEGRGEGGISEKVADARGKVNECESNVRGYSSRDAGRKEDSWNNFARAFLPEHYYKLS